MPFPIPEYESEKQRARRWLAEYLADGRWHARERVFLAGWMQLLKRPYVAGAALALAQAGALELRIEGDTVYWRLAEQGEIPRFVLRAVFWPPKKRQV